MKYSNFKITAESDNYIFAFVDCTEETGIWPFNKKTTTTIEVYLLKKHDALFKFFLSGEDAPYAVTKLFEAEKAKKAFIELMEKQK